jgi:hypothetical protein
MKAYSCMLLLILVNFVYGRNLEESNPLRYIGPLKQTTQSDWMQFVVNRDLPQQVNSKGFTLYEISSRAWLYELKEKYGTRINSLADVPLSEFYELRASGVDMVWMQGIWKVGEYGVQLDRKDPKSRENFLEKLPDCTDADIIGSPYAVVEYSVNPELGGDSGLEALREKLKAADLKLMLDFVPNHMAVDCVWSNDPTKREYFILAPPDERENPSPDVYLPDGRAYGRDPYSGAWKDSAQLNYWNQSLRHAMTENLMKVASMCDGIRVDMAMLILNDVIEKTWGEVLRKNHYKRPAKEFWEEAIAKLRSKYPNTILMAEVYWNLDQQLQDLGFDATYDKTLYDLIHANNLDNIRSYLRSKTEQFLAHSAHFVENHDEPRAAKYFGSRAVANSAASISFTLPGIRFQFHGEWQGKKNPLDIHLRRAAWEPEDAETLEFYRKLNQILSHDIFHQGNWSYIDIEADGLPDAWRLMAWKWRWIDTSYNNKVIYRLVVINHSDKEGSGCVPFDQIAEEVDDIQLVELFTGSSFPKSRQNDNEICFVVGPWSSQIFAY